MDPWQECRVVDRWVWPFSVALPSPYNAWYALSCRSGGSGALTILPSEPPPRLEMMGRLFDHARDALELWNDPFFHDFFGE